MIFSLMLLPFILSSIQWSFYEFIKSVTDKASDHYGFSGLDSFYLGILPLSYALFLRKEEIKIRKDYVVYLFCSLTMLLLSVITLFYNSNIVLFIFLFATFILSTFFLYKKSKLGSKRLPKSIIIISFSIFFIYITLIINLFPLYIKSSDNPNVFTDIFTHYVGLLIGLFVSIIIIRKV